MAETINRPKLSFTGVPSLDLTANPSSLGGYLSTSIQVGQQNAVQAELAPPSSIAALDFAQQEAVARGYLRHVVAKLDKENPDTSTILEGLNGAIRSKDFSSIEAFSPELASVLSIYAKNDKAYGNYNDFSKEFLQGQIAVSKSFSSLAQAEVDAVSARNIRNFVLDTPDKVTNIYNSVTRIPGKEAFASGVRLEIASLRSQAAAATDENITKALNERASLMEATLADGLVASIVRGKTPDDALRIRNALADNNRRNLSFEESYIFSVLTKDISPETRNHIDTQLGEYAAGPAKFTEAEQRKLDIEWLSSIREDLPQFRLLTDVGKIRKTANNYIAAIKGADGLPEGDAGAVQDEIYSASANAALNLAINKATTDADLLAMQDYVRSKDQGNLSAQVRFALDAFVEFGGLVKDNGFSNSAFNNAKEFRGNELKNIEQTRINNVNIQNTSTGRGDALTEVGQVAASNWVASMLDRYNTAVPIDLWRNPQYLQNPAYSKVFAEVYKTPNVMPKELLLEFESLANGSGDATVLAHYNAMKMISTPEGLKPNPALSAIDEEERGLIDLYSEVSVLTGGQADIAALTAAAKQNMLTEGFSKTVSRFLSGDEKASLDDWMVTSITDYELLNVAQQKSVKALVTHLVASTLAGNPNPQNSKSIARRINAQMNDWFPSGEGYVIDMGNGLPSSRTKFALSQTIGPYKAEFLSYVVAEVNRVAPDSIAKDFVTPTQSGILGGLAKFSQAIAEGYGAEIRPYIQLIPRGTDVFGGITYMVVSINPETGSIPQPIIQKDGSPLLISTAEKNFKAITDEIAANKQLRTNQEEVEKQKILDLQSGAIPLATLGN
jgi:hypothetical protein